MTLFDDIAPKKKRLFDDLAPDISEVLEGIHTPQSQTLTTAEEERQYIYDNLDTFTLAELRDAGLSAGELEDIAGQRFTANMRAQAGRGGISKPLTTFRQEKPEKVKRPRWDEFVDATARGIARVGSGGLTGAAAFTGVEPQAGAARALGLGGVFSEKPVEAKKRKQVSAKLKGQADFLWKLSQNPGIATQNKDLASKALNLIGETIPYITATTAAYVTTGPLGGFTVGSLVEGNSAYRTALDHKVPESKAKQIGIGVGVISGAVEAFGGKYAEQLALKAVAKLKSKVLKAGAVFGIGTVVEALEEGAQEIAAITGEETYRDVNWNERVSRTLSAMAGGGFLGGAMRGGSMAARRTMGRPPPTVGKLAPSRPVAPITPEKAIKPPPKVKEKITPVIEPEIGVKKGEVVSKRLVKPPAKAEAVEVAKAEPRKALPPIEETKKVIFDGTLYHNTTIESAQEIMNKGFTVQDTSKMPKQERAFVTGNLGDGVYLSPDFYENQNIAAQMGIGGDANLIVKPKKPLRLYNLGDKEGAASISIELSDKLKQQGYDGIIVNDPHPQAGGYQIVVFDPKNLKVESIVEETEISPEQLSKIDVSLAKPPAKAEPAKVVEKEIEYEEEAITEPTPSPKVEPRQARKLIPTGKLDPTNPKEAREIIRLHQQSGGGVGGIFETEWDAEYVDMTGRKGGHVVASVEYTSKQVDTAYRTIQKPVESPMPDTDLFAMPGKEAQMKAIAQKMAKVKGVVRPKKKGLKPLPKPTALPKAKVKTEDHIKAVYAATSKEESRYAINGVKVEGDTIVATDGRRMFWAKGKWGKDGIYLDTVALKKGSLGKPTKEKVNFPHWRDIVPDVNSRDAILVPSGGVYEDLDTVLRRVRQAASLTTEESKGITIIENKDGSLGFASAAPEVGHAEIWVNPGGRILGALNPQFLLDAIKFHAIRGDTAFELYFKDWDRPVLTRSPDGKTNTLTMPINVGEPSEAIKEAISEWPAKAEQVKPKADQFLDHIDDPKKPAGFAAVPIPESIQKSAQRAGQKAKRTAQNIEDDIDKFKFYPKAPPEFRNAVRIDMIGAMTKATKNVYQDAQEAIWGGLNKNDVGKSVEILYARDQLSRTKLGKGNPEISLEQAQEILDKAMKDASPEAVSAADQFKAIHDRYTDKLIKRGILTEGQRIEDHVRHYVEDYTPEWAPYANIPTRLKRPFRGYAKKAVGTTKTYRQDQESLLASLMEMEHHNLIEDFVETQVKKYDIKPTLSKEIRRKMFGIDARGYAKVPRPGRIYIHEGKRYRAYTPDIPFSRAIYLTEDGEAALGSFKNVALIPEDMYNLFRDFSQRGSRAVYLLNRATGYWKTMAILSHFSSFNVNNMVGDTWVAMAQHPKPLDLIGEYDTAIRYLTGKLEPKFAKQLEDFITKHDIKQTFAQAELAIGRRSKNPIAWLLRKSYQVSDFRESINRVAYASSLLKANQMGEGPKMVEAHNWIDTEGLSTEDALGKISREVLVDYQAQSKSFRRFVRGGIAPFGTWYFKMSKTIWKWFGKHPMKATLAFMALPIAAAAYNRRRKEINELEQQLPDYIRNRVHFVLGEQPDGTIRVLSLQLPQDVLIGTKIFSITVDHANRVINGEMTPREAAIETLKTWGISEYEGAKYLLTPWIRMYSGLKTGRDPYDKASVYRRDYNKMTWDEKAKDISAYILKTSVPFLGYTIQTYEKGLPQDVAFKKIVNSLAGKGAFGIYDVNKKGQAIIDGKPVEWKDIDKIRKLSAHEYKWLGQIEDDFVASGQEPREFLRSEKAKSSLLKIYDVWAQRAPELKKVTDRDTKISKARNRLGERLTNRVSKPRVLSKWYQVKISRAKTAQEKRDIAKRFAKIRKARIEELLEGLPRTAREVEIKGKLPRPRRQQPIKPIP